MVLPFRGTQAGTALSMQHGTSLAFTPFIMNKLFEKAASGTAFQPTAATEHAQGAVQRVDTVEREITVLLSTGLEVFDVPSDCPIRLRGEPIKLRLIQPRDQVRITFADHQGRLIAQLLDVQPDTTFSCFRL